MKYPVIILLVILLIVLLLISRWARMRAHGLRPDGSGSDSPSGPPPES